MTVAPVGVDDLLTYYDDATGERVGLSAAEVGRWSAATSALLVEQCGQGAGRQAAVLLPPHWQSAVILLGCWATGVEVSFRGWSTAGLTPAGDMLDVSFVHTRRIGNWLDDVPAAAYQFSVRLGPAAPTPAGYDDFEDSVPLPRRPWSTPSAGRRSAARRSASTGRSRPTWPRPGASGGATACWSTRGPPSTR
jgi:uncharacterized protein (TIGR03089 family)